MGLFGFSFFSFLLRSGVFFLLKRLEVINRAMVPTAVVPIIFSRVLIAGFSFRMTRPSSLIASIWSEVVSVAEGGVILGAAAFFGTRAACMWGGGVFFSFTCCLAGGGVGSFWNGIGLVWWAVSV